MYSYPKIPLNILFLDSLKGKRKQIYTDCEGQHLYYKELDFIRKVQKFLADKRDSAKKQNVDYCRVKFADTMHKICLKEFGYSPYMTDWSVKQ